MGVCDHSGVDFWDHYSVFSIQGAASAQTRTDFTVFLDEHDIGFKAMQGSYKGETEHCFIVNTRHIPFIWEHGWLEGEESILNLAGMQRVPTNGQHSRRFARKATLVYCTDGRTEELGWFVACTERTAKEHDAWTYDPTSGLYWITRKELGA